MQFNFKYFGYLYTQFLSLYKMLHSTHSLKKDNENLILMDSSGSKNI